MQNNQKSNLLYWLCKPNSLNFAKYRILYASKFRINFRFQLVVDITLIVIGLITKMGTDESSILFLAFGIALITKSIYSVVELTKVQVQFEKIKLIGYSNENKNMLFQ